MALTDPRPIYPDLFEGNETEKEIFKDLINTSMQKHALS